MSTNQNAMNDFIGAGSSERESATVAEIWRLLWQLDPCPVKEYILSLEEPLSKSPVVATVASIAYMQDGNYTAAAQVIDAADVKSLVQVEGWQRREPIVCLALASGIINVYRTLEYDRLIQLAEEIEGIYVTKAVREGQLDAGALPISRLFDSASRIWIEYLLLSARNMLVAMGWGRWTDFHATYGTRLREIVEALTAKGAVSLASVFVSSVDATTWLGSAGAAAVYLLRRLDSFTGKDVMQRFVTLIQLAGLQAGQGSDQAASTLDAAFVLADEIGNETATLICQYHRIRLFNRKTQSPKICLEQILSLADQFLVRQNHSLHYTSLNLAVAIVVNDSTLQAQLDSILDRVMPRLREMEDEFLVLRLEVLRAYDSSQHTVSAEQARLWLEELLDHRADTLTPVQRADVYHALYISYTTLADRGEATLYAEKYFDLLVEIDGHSVSGRSKARHDLALSRLAGLKDYDGQQGPRLFRDDEWDRLSEYREKSKALALGEVADLESWITIDLRNNLQGLMQAKIATLDEYKSFIRLHFADEAVRQDADPKNDSVLGHLENSGQIDLGHLLQLARAQQGRDGVRLAEQQLESVLKALNSSCGQRADAYYVCGLAYDVLARFDKTSRPTTTAEMDLHLHLQMQHLREHRDLCTAMGDHHSLIRTALPFQATVTKLIARYPDRTSEYKAEAEDYFLRAERGAELYQRSILGSHDLASLLQLQKAASGGMAQHFYRGAVQFYLQQRDAVAMWRWAQKGRARALLSIVTRQPTSSDRLLSALQKSAQTRGQLAADAVLITEQEQGSSAIDQLRFRHAVSTGARPSASASRPLLSIPSLQKLLLDAPLAARGFGFDESRAVFDTIQGWGLSPGTNVVLVSWAFDMAGPLCLMAVDCRDQQIHCRSKLRLRDDDVRAWVRQNLIFPEDATQPLESDKPLEELIPLVEALDKFSSPGDLLVLSPPAELSAVPLHAIPLNPLGPPLIERNPVVYTSSFDLYAQCLRRIKPVPEARRPGSLLADAVFAAAYEEPDRPEERERIFDQMTRLAAKFGAQAVTGSDLTPRAFSQLLGSAPWVHYHGHAVFDTAEPLKSTLVLSGGAPLTNDLASLSLEHDKDHDHGGGDPTAPTAAAPAARQEPPHLPLQTQTATADFNVSNIFAMDLTGRSPLVCCVACDSCTQDVRASDEPLGLGTALFCAGASSVLGTLWPIETRAGRAFTDVFYACLERRWRGSDGDDGGGGGGGGAAAAAGRASGVVDVARALRDAVLRLRQTHVKPVHWAGFVLHGAGFYSGGMTD